MTTRNHVTTVVRARVTGDELRLVVSVDPFGPNPTANLQTYRLGETGATMLVKDSPYSSESEAVAAWDVVEARSVAETSPGYAAGLPDGRRCLVILEGQRDERGYIPSLVVENQPGHWPMIGRGEHSAPWYFGTDYDEAQRNVDAYNLRTYSLEPHEAARIVLSSMAAGRLQ